MIDQQLCRWLLLSLDRLQGNQLVMTLALISNMLGVRQKVGLIDYQRGRIQELDHAGLENRTCECYAVVKKEYDRLLPNTLAA